MLWLPTLLARASATQPPALRLVVIALQPVQATRTERWRGDGASERERATERIADRTRARPDIVVNGEGATGNCQCTRLLPTLAAAGHMVSNSTVQTRSLPCRTQALAASALLASSPTFLAGTGNGHYCSGRTLDPWLARQSEINSTVQRETRPPSQAVRCIALPVRSLAGT